MTPFGFVFMLTVGTLALTCVILRQIVTGCVFSCSGTVCCAFYSFVMGSVGLGVLLVAASAAGILGIFLGLIGRI